MFFSRKLAIWFFFTNEIPLTLDIIMPSWMLHCTIKQSMNAEILLLALGICKLVSFQWISCMPNIEWSLFLWVHLLQHVSPIHYKRSTRFLQLNWLKNGCWINHFIFHLHFFHVARIFWSTLLKLTLFAAELLDLFPKSLLV